MGIRVWTAEIMMKQQMNARLMGHAERNEMKEVTRIINAQITVITEIDDCDKLADESAMAGMIKMKLGADDVVVADMKDFVLKK